MGKVTRYRTVVYPTLCVVSTHTGITFKHTALKSLQVRAITHLALMRFFQLNYVLNKSRRQDLNLQPADYETAALPIELRGHGMDAGFHPVVFTCERITGIEPAFPAWEAGIFVSIHHRFPFARIFLLNSGGGIYTRNSCAFPMFLPCVSPLFEYRACVDNTFCFG